MEVMMSSPVQECSLMENDNSIGTLNLTKSQIRKRRKALKRKLNANLDTLEKREDNENLKKMSVSSPGGTGDEKSSGTNATDDTVSRRRRKKKKMKKDNPDLDGTLSNRERTHEGLSMTKVPGVTCNETVLGETTTLDAKMASKEQDCTEVAEGKTGVSKSAYLNVNGKEIWKMKLKSKNNRPTLAEILNPQYFQSLEAEKGEVGSSTTSKDNPASKKQKRQKLNNPDLGEILTTRESTQEGLRTTKVLEVKSGETVSDKTVTPDANMVSKGDNTEVANGKMEEGETTDINLNGKNKKKRRSKSKNKQPTLGEILSPQDLQNLEGSKGEKGSGTTSTDNPVSKKQKSQKLNKSSDLGDGLSTYESTQEGSSLTKVLEVKSGETVSLKTADLDASMVSEGDHKEVANGKTGESETTDLNVNGNEKEKKKKKSKSKNKQPTLGEILNQQHLENLEAARGETDSGTTSASNPESQQRKREKLKNNNPGLGDILPTHESTQERLSTTKFLEVKSCEMVSDKTAISDANLVSKGDNTEVVNRKMEESETTDINVNGKNKKKKRSNSKNKQPTLGEILSLRDLQNLEASKGEKGSGTTSTDNPVSKKQKGQKRNKNPNLGDTLSTHESTHEGLGTTKVLEVESGETVSGKTSSSDANMVSKEDYKEVANGKMQENVTNNLNVNGEEKKNKGPTFGENLNAQYLQNFEAKHEIGSESTISKSIVYPQIANAEMGSTNIVLESAKPTGLEGTEAKPNKALAIKSQTMRVKEITHVATLGKKLLILDVNGLLGDVVSGRTKDIEPDKYGRGKSIFKRPYLDDFLGFCFENFHVGIWSSRVMRNLNPVVDFLLGDLKKKLVFLWDGCRCIDSGIKTLEVKYKYVLLKDLRKIWDKDGPNKSWVKGTFHESNTLLVDDSPYKALLNPKHTGIFPASYSYRNRDDNFLGPNGGLRTYLEGLAAADDVKTYVEQHPFGQVAIDDQSPHWAFYSRVLERLNDKDAMERIIKKKKKRRRCCKL